MADEMSHEASLQSVYVESLQDGFVGRKTLLKQCTMTLEGRSSGLLVVTGKHGAGKSSLMVTVFSCYRNFTVCFCVTGIVLFYLIICFLFCFINIRCFVTFVIK